MNLARQLGGGRMNENAFDRRVVVVGGWNEWTSPSPPGRTTTTTNSPNHIHHPIQVVVDVDDELFCVKWIIGMDERRGILGEGRNGPRGTDGPDGPDKSGRTEHWPPPFGGHFKWAIGAKRGAGQLLLLLLLAEIGT
ncbi:hypothetical protein niasHT_030738 [Heterodera trifolii]|uniref:Uncharacterized protein n=1 Tax=Heterodera trifolii TaxID=157864 RepID=A0ABD2HSX9_9BILA